MTAYDDRLGGEFTRHPSFLSGVAVVLCLVGAGGALGCGDLASVDDAAPTANHPCGPEGCFNDAGQNGAVSDVAPGIGSPDAADEAAAAVHPFCALACQPDNVEACSGFNGGSVDGPDAGAPGSSDASTAEGGNMGGGDYEPPPTADAGVLDEDAAVEGAASFACQVQKASGMPVAQCVLAGTGTDGAPCVNAGDCAPGFACVGDEDTGVCRAYCCHGTASCQQPGTYCAERTSRDVFGRDPGALMLPVCVAGDPCVLLPADGQSSGCDEGQACSIVRNDGTTACVTPGSSVEDEPCPCAEGYVCSRATNRCVQLCHVAEGYNECLEGVCQGGTTGLPEGYGVCVRSRNR